ncbi:MAG: protein kinase domain-containing protein [Planctomycetota bacterium]
MSEKIFTNNADDNEWLARLREAQGPPPPGRIGEYEFIEEAALGAQGVVIRARQPGTNRLIALKKLRAGSLASPEEIQRFEREVEILSSLSHRNIVTIYGFDISTGVPMIAMEWVDGVAVTEWSKDRITTKHGIVEILRLFLQICDAVHHAHLRGVIHRDLKPSNILADASGTARVLDFGLAKRTNKETALLTHAEGFLGTPAYAAPEQLRRQPGFGGELDARCDIYSLGVVLFEMLTKRLPFDAAVPIADLIHSIEFTAPPRPSSISRIVDADLDRIVIKCLEKSREDRYQSVDALAQDVSRFLANEPVLAHPPSFFYYFKKTVVRYPKTAALTTITFVLAVTFVTISMIQSARLARESVTIDSLLSLVLNFVDSATPGSLGPDVRVLDLLESRSSEIHTKLANRPDMLAAIHNYSGHIYLNLGKLADAERHARLALEYRIKAFGESHMRIAQIRCLLGEILMQRGRGGEARELFTIALETQRRDPENSPVAHTLIAFGELEIEQGEYKNAQMRAIEAAEIRRKRFGERSHAVAECYLLEAWAERGLLNYAIAEEKAQLALSICREVLHDRHPLYAECHTALGAIDLASGKLVRAVENLQLSANILKNVLTGPLIQTARSLALLAEAHANSGHSGAAAANAKDAAEMIRAIRGEADVRLMKLDQLVKK